jgi:hypothetical protein
MECSNSQDNKFLNLPEHTFDSKTSTSSSAAVEATVVSCSKHETNGAFYCTHYKPPAQMHIHTVYIQEIR